MRTMTTPLCPARAENAGVSQGGGGTYDGTGSKINSPVTGTLEYGPTKEIGPCVEHHQQQLWEIQQEQKTVKIKIILLQCAW